MPFPIITFIVAIMLHFLHMMHSLWRDTKTRGLVKTAIVLSILGTVLFHYIEEWSWFDSLYYTVITLTTIGYGDLSPVTTLGKMVAMIYSVLSVGVLGSLVTIIAQRESGSVRKL
ncbi:MAG: two pore domain potassium channel family protein [Chlamydiia bacterium]|nr:two pore domain potassium channel family protein [Chlamydiia bacterium]